MIFILLYVLCAISVHFSTCSLIEGQNKLCNICSKFKQPNDTREALKKFCGKHVLHPSGRCCYSNSNTTSSVLGVDWSHCQLSHLPVISEKDKIPLQWMAVALNDNITIDHSDLRFYRSLSTLLVPSKVSCNNDTFTQRKLLSDNITMQCTTPADGCIGVKCPTHAHCAPDGPGLNMCPCDKGWNSYRCLKKEGFPAVQWIAGFSATTIVLCLSLKIAQKRSLANAGL